MHNAFHESILRPYNGEPQERDQLGDTTGSALLWGQSPCKADTGEVGLCAATLRKIGKCGYCVVCHKNVMRTYDLPTRCISHADHRVDLPSDFVTQPQPQPQARPEVPADHGGVDEDGGAEAMAEAAASSPPLGPPTPPLEEGNDGAIAAHQKSLREARYEKGMAAKDG